MDMLLTGCIIICLLIIGYIGIIFIMYWRKNPIYLQNAVTLPHSNREVINPSIVTSTYLGTRGDMGNQIFQLACVISAGKRSGANIIIPTRIATLPINNLFNLNMFEFNDITPDATFYEYDNYEHIVIPDDGRNYNIRGYRQAYKY